MQAIIRAFMRLRRLRSKNIRLQKGKGDEDFLLLKLEVLLLNKLM